MLLGSSMLGIQVFRIIHVYAAIFITFLFCVNAFADGYSLCEDCVNPDDGNLYKCCNYKGTGEKITNPENQCALNTDCGARCNHGDGGDAIPLKKEGKKYFCGCDTAGSGSGSCAGEKTGSSCGTGGKCVRARTGTYRIAQACSTHPNTSAASIGRCGWACDCATDDDIIAGAGELDDDIFDAIIEIVGEELLLDLDQLN